MAMQDEGRDNDPHSLSDVAAGEHIRLDCLPRQSRRRGIKAHCLVDHRARLDEAFGERFRLARADLFVGFGL